MMVFKWDARDPSNRSTPFSVTVCACTVIDAMVHVVSRLKAMRRMDIAHHYRINDFKLASPRWSQIWPTHLQKQGHWKTEGLLDNDELIGQQRDLRKALGKPGSQKSSSQVH